MNLKSKLKTITNVILIMTAICALLLSLCFFLSFEEALGYFDGGTVLPSLLKAFYIIVVLYIVISGYIYIKCKKTTAQRSPLPPHLKAISLSVGALSVIYAVCGFVLDMISKTNTSYRSMALLGALAFGGFLIFVAAKDGFEYHSTKLLLICFAVFFPFGMTIKNLFYLERPSNSVENVLSVCFAVSFLFYILNEGKRIMNGIVGRSYFVSVLLSLFSSATLSVSYIAAYIGGAVNEADRFREMLLCLALSVYLVCILFHFISSAEESTLNEEKSVSNTAENSEE